MAIAYNKDGKEMTLEAIVKLLIEKRKHKSKYS